MDLCTFLFLFSVPRGSMYSIYIYRGFLNIPSIDPIRLSSSSFSVLLSVSHPPFLVRNGLIGSSA